MPINSMMLHTINFGSLIPMLIVVFNTLLTILIFLIKVFGHWTDTFLFSFIKNFPKQKVSKLKLKQLKAYISSKGDLLLLLVIINVPTKLLKTYMMSCSDVHICSNLTVRKGKLSTPT